MRASMVIVLAAVLGGCTLTSPEVKTLSVSECTAELAFALRSEDMAGVDGYLAPHIPAVQLASAFRRICRGLVLAENPPEPNESREKWLRRIGYERPLLFLPLCQSLVDAHVAYGRRLSLFRFASTSEQKRFRTEHCRLAARYLKQFKTPPDVTAAHMGVDNLDIYVPVCASPARIGMARSWPSLTPAQLQLISRRTCSRALSTGVVTYGIPGVVDRSIDKEQWHAIAMAVAREVVSGTGTERRQ